MPAPLSFKNDEQADERLNPANDLHAREQAGYDREFGDIAKNYDKTADPAQENQNIAAAREQENSPSSGGWAQKFTGKGTNAFPDRSTREKFITNTKGFLKKKGATGAIISIMLGGGIFGGGLLTPGIALIHIKEVVENKIDTQASVIAQRSTMLTRARAFGGTNSAVKGKCTTGGIKIFCQFSSMNEDQYKTMKENNMKLTDKNGKEIVPDENGRYSSAKYIESTDGSFKPIKATQYRTAIDTDAVFRGKMQAVYPSRFNAFKDKIGSIFFQKNKLTENPKWTNSEEGGDSKTNSKEVNTNIREVETGGGTTDPNIATSGVGDFDTPLSEQVSSIQSSFDKGAVNQIPLEIGAVDNLTPTELSSFTKIKGFVNSQVNAFSILNGICVARTYLSVIVTAAKIGVAVQQMRYASQFLSTADKIKAGDATPNDVSVPMDNLERTDKFGDSFGDSTGYNYVEYGKTTNTPIQTGSGSPLMSLFSNSLSYMNYIPGLFGISPHMFGVGCKALLSIIGQITTIGISVVADLFGGGEVATVAQDAAKDGSIAVIKAVMKEMQKQLSEKLTKDAIKDSIKSSIKGNEKTLALKAATLTGVVFSAYLLGKYLVPYLASAATGTLFSSGMNGVAAMDTITAGAGRMNGGIAQARGMTAMSPGEAMAFMNFNNASTGQYVADMQAQANPFDINNPYSMSNSVGFTLGNFISSINPIKNPSSLLSAPVTIFSSILHPSTDSQAFASSASDEKALMAECQDSDATQNGTIATDPFCNPIYGFTDTNALQNIQPDDIVTYMYDNKYIDGNGDPVAGSTFDSYSTDCFGDAADTKIISTLVDSESQLPVGCYNESKSGLTNEQYTMFHLYQIDHGIEQQMDNPYNPDSGSDTSGGDTSTGNLIGAPPNVDVVGSGWQLKDNTDYSSIPCAAGTTEDGINTNQGNGTTVRVCLLKGKKISSVISTEAVMMLAAAQKDGVNITISSGLRTYAEQVALRRQNCPGGSLTVPAEQCTPPTAIPGQSNHEKGTAMDLNATGSNSVSQWLKKNAATYGFYNLPSESWHWSTSGQ